MSDEWLPKDGLEFVAFEDNLCLPIWSNLRNDHQKIFIERYRAGLDLKAEALRDGVDYMHAKLAMPIQRVFHKGRLEGFKVTSAAERLAKIENS